MNWPKRVMIVVFLLLGVSMSQVAWAWGGHGGGHWRGHGGRGGVDIVIDPLGWMYYPPPSPYYYPPPIYLPPPQPPVYIEQAPPRPVAPPAQSYWYYCTNPQGYYPTIKECPGGWLKVVPQTQP